jgi:poly(3-hydroxybutyrate) depolymerase
MMDPQRNRKLVTPKQSVALRSTLLLLTLFLLLSPLTVAQDKPDNAGKVIKESILSNKKKRTYYLFVPATIKPPAPLIVLLHGSGRDGTSLVDKWKDLAGKEGIIIVGPDSGGEGWSAPRDGPDFLHDLVEDLKSKYPINPRRVYLFGHSAGAVFALMMSTAESEYFAATAIHAGAFRSPGEFENISHASRKIPLAIWVGTKDQFFPLADVRATRDAFRSKGFTIEVTEMPGHDHWYYDLAPAINAGAWEFLRNYELTSDPRYSEAAYAAPGNAGDANKLIAEINKLVAGAQAFVQKANDKEKEFTGKDLSRDREEIRKIAQEESAILKEGAELWRAATERADNGSSLKLSGKYKEYFGLIARYDRKCADLLDAMREGAEAFLINDSIQVIEGKRDDAQKRAEKLQQEIDVLQKAIDKVMH